ncbi:hypothetical protein HanRHA438_Chr02g0065041 [Helianthus annuus]|nr:hypothetical protein HanHA300_Chr02g0052341 [Helianthus annuus]KAJ0777102.1 hypothetical protein HanLR1_Chr02g0053421 [Helianthus annuus]KAJ0939775.1 hypothetical protein HanRHA438_Chr02g0065041 [Helianthus annuus]
MVNDASVSSFYIGFVLGSVTVMYMSAFRVSSVTVSDRFVYWFLYQSYACIYFQYSCP